jgi:hypothetical protein
MFLKLGNLSKIKAIPEFRAQVLNSGVDFLPLSQDRTVGKGRETGFTAA